MTEEFIAREAGHENQGGFNLSSFLCACRPILYITFAFWASLLAALRSFGGDKDLYEEVYPHVAEGWGAWYWLAQFNLNFNLFYFIVTFFLAVQILPLCFPRARRSESWIISVVFLMYMIFWFLFLQTRYGTALAMLAPLAASGGTALMLLAGGAALLVHKAVAGGVLLLLLWKGLQRSRYQLVLACIISAIGVVIINAFAPELATLAGYGSYVGWWDTELPAPNTPYKFFYLIGAFVVWKLMVKNGMDTDTRQWQIDTFLSLTLLFLPMSYYVVFAGRTFQMFSVILFYSLLRMKIPRPMQVVILIPYVAELGMLLLHSEFYF